MGYDPLLHSRHSIRFQNYDYTQSGAYYVALCTQEKRCLFGNATEEDIQLNAFGRLVAGCWHELPKHYPHVELDAFVIMPNHIHGVIILNDAPANPNPLLGHVGAGFKPTPMDDAPAPRKPTPMGYVGAGLNKPAPTGACVEFGICVCIPTDVPGQYP